MARRMKVKAGNTLLIQPGEPSPGRLDPYSHLAAKILAQALEDFHSANWIHSLDALLFFLDPDGAALFLSSLDFQLTDDRILEALIGTTLEKRKTRSSATIRVAARVHQRHEPGGIRSLSKGAKATASGLPVIAGYEGSGGESRIITERGQNEA